MLLSLVPWLSTLYWGEGGMGWGLPKQSSQVCLGGKGGGAMGLKCRLISSVNSTPEHFFTAARMAQVVRLTILTIDGKLCFGYENRMFLWKTLENVIKKHDVFVEDVRKTLCFCRRR